MFTRKSWKKRSERYDEYRMSVPEKALTFLVAAAFLSMITVLFYDAWLVGLVLSVPAGFFLVRIVSKVKAEKRRQALKKQFLSAVLLLGDYLKTGYSVENALSQSVRELSDLFGEKSDIVREWRKMELGLKMNRTAEDLFSEFAERSGLSEIRDFSELFGIVKRSGGQLSDIVRETGNLLETQFYVEEQIRTSIASKRLEQKIMDVMPAAILLYVRVSSPDLLEPLYTTSFGRILMTVCLVLYAFAVVWAEKIVAIKL